MTSHNRPLSADDPPYLTDEGEDESDDDGPSALAQDVIAQLQESGDSQALAVGECLETIAGNGGEQATDDYLAGCAHEIALAAVGAANGLDPATTYVVMRQIDVAAAFALIEDVARGNTEFAVLEERAGAMLRTLSFSWLPETEPPGTGK